MSNLIFHAHWSIFIGLAVILLVVALELTYRFGGPLAQHFETNDEMWNAIRTGLLALVAFCWAFRLRKRKVATTLGASCSSRKRMLSMRARSVPRSLRMCRSPRWF